MPPTLRQQGELTQADRARLRDAFLASGGKVERLPPGAAAGSENQRWLLDRKYRRRFEREKRHGLSHDWE